MNQFTIGSLMCCVGVGLITAGSAPILARGIVVWALMGMLFSHWWWPR